MLESQIHLFLTLNYYPQGTGESDALNTFPLNYLEELTAAC